MLVRWYTCSNILECLWFIYYKTLFHTVYRMTLHHHTLKEPKYMLLFTPLIDWMYCTPWQISTGVFFLHACLSTTKGLNICSSTVAREIMWSLCLNHRDRQTQRVQTVLISYVTHTDYYYQTVKVLLEKYFYLFGSTTGGTSLHSSNLKQSNKTCRRNFGTFPSHTTAILLLSTSSQNQIILYDQFMQKIW